MTDAPDWWDPRQYAKFEAERRQPFVDLLAFCHPVPGGRVVDLGCGGGERTVELHQALAPVETIGIDNSEKMLAGAAGRALPGMRFAWGDLATFAGPPADVVFANASLHWVPDHHALLARLAGTVKAGGQLAFQVPANSDHVSHQLARAVAGQEPFRSELSDPDRAGPGRPDPAVGTEVLSPREYAEVLHALGSTAQRVVLEVYGHQLASVDDVAEWTKGTLLSAYRSRLTPERFEQFFVRYRDELRYALGDQRPYFYAFPRILCWAGF